MDDKTKELVAHLRKAEGIGRWTKAMHASAEAIERLSAELDIEFHKRDLLLDDISEIKAAYSALEKKLAALKSELEEAKKEAQHYGEFCGKFRHELSALKSASAEPVAIVGLEHQTWTGYNGQWTPPGEPRKTAMLLKDVPLGERLYLHPAPAVQIAEAEPVAWIGIGLQPVLPEELKKLQRYEPGFATLYDTPLFPTPAVPEGWQLVPKEPTEEMLVALDEHGMHYDGCNNSWFVPLKAYIGMLAAAPKPQVQEDAKDAALKQGEKK